MGLLAKISGHTVVGSVTTRVRVARVEIMLSAVSAAVCVPQVAGQD